ncbi:hypothetical protein NLU13_1141 [Sarocladium strictum]|uniref:Uncharacterized protein n=1 Tax=Sarocladium strictum TaxID=5046 RepID=A0AA39GQE3_SARSR|nr:hypothetical protein NLU13_1141 [Sarocladium strictum]
MSYSKQAEARRYAQPDEDAPPPAYDDPGDAALGESSATRAAAVASSISQDASPVTPSTQAQNLSPDNKAHSNDSQASRSQPPTTAGPSNPTSDHVPTVDSPFDFPTQAPLPPAYTRTESSSSSSIVSRPIAIPQASPSPTSPFLPAYAPLLLTYGITPSSFLAFLSTISAFLTAKVSDRAISHAGEMAKAISDPPKTSFKNVVSRAKAVGKDVGRNAKKGNVVGAALGVVGGTVTISLAAVGGLIASATSLPGTTLAAAVKKPKTPRQRAAAYIAVANGKWLAARGLYAVLLDSMELAEVLKKPVTAITAEASDKDASVEGQLRGLEAHVEKLDLHEPNGSLELGKQTLWLVLSKAVVEGTGEVGTISES